LRVYHFVNREHGLSDLRKRHLKIATIDELNDPFELLAFAPKDREFRSVYSQIKSAIAQFNGFLYFSGSWRNPVQWSHYADNHRGICLGFDITTDVMPVTYVRKRLTPDFAAIQARGAAGQDHVFQMLTTKFSHWRYENEYRRLVRLERKDAKGLYFSDFDEQVILREVIVGHNSTISRYELAKALGDLTSEVEVWKARLAFRSFRVVRQMSNKLWD
jgi:hypothetical protein